MDPLANGQKTCNRDCSMLAERFSREEEAQIVAAVGSLMPKRGRGSSRSRQEENPAPSPSPQAGGHATEN